MPRLTARPDVRPVGTRWNVTVGVAFMTESVAIVDLCQQVGLAHGIYVNRRTRHEALLVHSLSRWLA